MEGGEACPDTYREDIQLSADTDIEARGGTALESGWRTCSKTKLKMIYSVPGTFNFNHIDTNLLSLLIENEINWLK